MIGSIIGGAMKIGGAIFGGIKAAKAAKRVKENIKQQQAENEAWYDRRYNEDATQRSDAQALLRMTEDSIKNRNRQAAGTQAVMGGTEESVAAARAANNQARTSAVTGINTSAEARKAEIENTYMSKDAQLNSALNDLEMKKAGAVTQAVQGVTNAAGGIMSGVMKWDYGRQ